MATTKITSATTIDVSALLKDKAGVALTGSKLQSALTKIANFEAAVEANRSASLTVGSTKFSYTKLATSGTTGPAIQLTNGTSTFASATTLAAGTSVTPTPAPTSAPTSAPTTAPTATTYSLTANKSVVTEGTSATFTVTRTGSTTSAVTLVYNIAGDDNGGTVTKATPGTDTNVASGTVTIAAGATTGTFTVSATSDTSAEGLEGIKVSLFNDTTVVASKSLLINDDPNAPVSGQNLPLNAGTNIIAGGAGDDTFDAGLSSTNQQTLNSGDRLDGGAGNDVLLATITSSVTPASLTSVEDIQLTVTTASTLDLSNSSGVKTVSSAGSTAGTTISGLSKAVGVSIRDTAAAQTITFNDVSGSADSATVNVSNVSQATTVVTSILGVETLTLNATGNASSTSTTGIGTLTATQTTKLVVTGDKALNIVDNLESNIITVDASANTGGVNLDFNGTSMTVTGGAGNDDFSFEATGNVSVNGGAGDDTFRFDATGTLTTSDTVEGGNGIDTLRARSEELDDFTAVPTTYRITGVERITADTAVLAGATITLSNISTTADRLTLTAANAGAATFNFNAGASTLSNAVATVGAINVDADGSATTDSLTIIHGGASAVNSLNGQALTSTDFETVTINTTGTGAAGNQSVGAVSITASTGGTPTLAITGANQLTTGVVSITGGVINASGMSASTNGLIMVTGQNDANTITGSAVADTLFGAITTGRNQTIDGGAGNDSITAGAGNDSLLGGDGNDTINGGSGNDNINGGAGNDRIVVSATANLTSADTVVGGDGTDTLAATAALTDSAAVLQSVSGFEVLELAPAATQTVTLSNFINNQTFSRIDFGDAGGATITANNAAAAVTSIRLIQGVDGDAVTFARLVDNSTNSLSIDARNTTAQTVTTLQINDEETVTYTSVDSAADVTVTTLNAGDLTSLTISGAGDLVVTNALSSTLVNTVNASAATGAVTVSAANAVVSVTMTGGSGANTFTGGAIADSITGGAAVDVLVGGAGNDTINAGAGDDSVTGSAGADVINVGSGTDTIIYLADTGESTTITSLTNPVSLSTSTTDLVTGMAAGDVILLGAAIGYTATDGDTTATNAQIQTTASTSALVQNGVSLIRGSYSSGIFVSNSSGADTLIVFDTDEAAGTSSYQAVVLVGTAGVSGTVAEVGTSDTFAITLA